jgi:hypothetical protein
MRFFRCAPPGATLVPEPFGSVLVRANVSFRALPRSSEDARGRHRLARGRPMRTRPGRISLHGVIPTSATGRCSREGVFFRRVSSIPTASDTLVASSAPYAWLRFSSNLQAFARRPPRPVPRGPRERRALCRSRVPSADRHDAHPARAEARTKPRSLHRRRGAHVMRIAELR